MKQKPSLNLYEFTDQGLQKPVPIPAENREKLAELFDALASGELYIEGEVRDKRGRKQIKRVPIHAWKLGRVEVWKGDDISDRLRVRDKDGRVVRTYLNPIIRCASPSAQ